MTMYAFDDYEGAMLTKGLMLCGKENQKELKKIESIHCHFLFIYLFFFSHSDQFISLLT